MIGRLWWRKLQSLASKSLRYHLTVSRAISWAFGQFSYLTGRSQNLGLPRTLWIEVTNACNLECSICPTGVGTLSRSVARMKPEQFAKIIDDVQGSLMRVVFSGYGEPFLNTDLFEMLAHARKKRIFTEVYSNLLIVNDDTLRRIIESKLDLLVVAIDLSPEGKNWRYVRSTTRDIAKVRERLTRLAELKKELGSPLPIVRLSYPVTKDNEHLLDQARAFAQEVQADEFLPKTVNALVAGQSIKDMKAKWIPTGLFDRYSRRRVGKGHCQWPYSGALVYANGEVSPCCYLGRGEKTLGNVITDGGVRAVWNGEKYQDFRRRLMHDVKSVPICAGCVERFDRV